MDGEVLITKENTYEFVKLLLDIGEGMLCSGAEVKRVEDTLYKMGEAYGLKEIDPFVIPAVITVTVRPDDDFELTQTRRISEKNVTVNLFRLQKLNNISYLCRTKRRTLEELRTLIEESYRPVEFMRFFIGCILTAASFSIFFGGKLIDGVIAALFAAAVCLFQRKTADFISNRVFFNFVCAFAIGLFTVLLNRCLPYFNTDKVLIGNIMLLIPGVSFTVSVRDIILGDTISGALRIIESLFLTAGLALGFWLAFVIGG